VLWYICKAWVALTAGHYEETVGFAGQARETNAEFPDIYAVLASAYGHLGNTAAARAAWEELLRRMPGLTASDERLNRPFARAVDRERFIGGLRAAGAQA